MCFLFFCLTYFWIRLTYSVLSDVTLYSLLLHFLIYWVFPEFALCNLFLHCLTYSVTLIFALTYLFGIDKVCFVWLTVALSDISTINKPRPAYGGIMCLYITSWTTIAIGGALRTTWLYSYIMRSMCLLLWRNNNRRATEKDVADFWITLIFSLSNLFYIVWVCLSILFLHCLTYSVFFLSFFI